MRRGRTGAGALISRDCSLPVTPRLPCSHRLRAAAVNLWTQYSAVCHWRGAGYGRVARGALSQGRGRHASGTPGRGADQL